MIRTIQISLAIIILMATAYLTGSQLNPVGKIYQPISLSKRADLDYELIKEIDSLSPPYPVGSKYQIGDLPTQEGQYRIYKFISKFFGRSKFQDEPRLFHDLLVIKTDDKKNILDAYHYTLEWTDSPSLDLYRSTKKGILLKNGLNIKKLGLTNISNGEELTEDGFIYSWLYIR